MILGQGRSSLSKMNKGMGVRPVHNLMDLITAHGKGYL